MKTFFDSIFLYLFDAASFLPHGVCLAWRPDLVALHVGADLGIAVAYFSIPAALIYFVRRRRDLEYRPLFGLFAAFILACGATHVLGIMTLWQPMYGLQGMVKVMTAVISVITAIAIWPVIPKALALPAPAALRAANDDLHDEIRRRELSEKDLRRAHDELEQRVRERTRALQLSQARVIEERDRAEAASKAKSEFLASMSHEIRTPLNAIIGFAEALELDIGAENEKSRNESLRNIASAGRHLNMLLTNVIDFPKIEAGELEISTVETDPVEVLQENLPIIRQLASTRDIEVTFEATSRSSAMLDSSRLSQIVLNLASNAVKYNIHGGKLGIRCDETEDGVIRISVEDTGAGIPEAERQYVFAPFDQVRDPAISIPGTRHGLSMCKALCTMMGGTIGFKSEEGRGSTFWVDFPVCSSGVKTAD